MPFKWTELREKKLMLRQKCVCSEWDFAAEQTSKNTCERESQCDWIVCVQAEDELNISPGLLCCCGSVWEEKASES